MDSMKSYFDYIILMICGFPKISLKGKKEDWARLLEKVKNLEKMNTDNKLDLNWWLKELVPVVEKICETAVERKLDRAFWGNMYKESERYGGSTVEGWITAFIPYVIVTIRRWIVILVW